MPTINVKMRVFVPKEVLNEAAVLRNIQHTMIQKTVPDLRRHFHVTVGTWTDKPNFPMEHYFGVRVHWVKVYTYSEKYRLVNAGARPHVITPRRAKILRFQTGYRAKTRARVIDSFAGGKFANYISTPIVHHPGFEARAFDETIAEEYQDTFLEDIQDAITDALP